MRAAVTTDRSGPVWQRTDHHWGHVTVFDPRSGDKLRLGLKPAVATAVPELVDVALTHRCYAGCRYCYMGSTPQGQDAHTENLRWMARTFGEAGVLEVALGGGEPTLHPDFLEVLGGFRSAGVVPNFTTRNLGYVRRHWSALQAVMGGLAYSVEGPEGVTHLARLLGGLTWAPGQVNLQVIMGLMERAALKELMRRAAGEGMRVTLLGYKTTGRGALVAPQDHPWWIEDVLQAPCDVSIDTALAAAWEAELLAAGVSRALFHTTEGVWSAYVDAVEMRLYQSSYSARGPEAGWPLDGAWLTHFAQISRLARAEACAQRGRTAPGP